MTDERDLEDDLVAWGKVIVLETLGRSSGLPRRVSVGFLEDGGQTGSYRVAASDDATHWARNLITTGACYVIADGVRLPYRATRLDGSARSEVTAGLILKYGTPSERLGGGPAFRLDPAAPERADSADT